MGRDQVSLGGCQLVFDACFFFQWAIKIRADTRKAQAIPLLVDLLAIDYDPTIRAAAIALRNLCVDSENKKVVGKAAKLDHPHSSAGF